MNPDLQAQIAQALMTMKTSGLGGGGAGQPPTAVPPNQMSTGGGTMGAPIANPMQGIGQLAQTAGQGMRQRQMAGYNPAFPQAPGGIFGLNNPMMKYSMGGGLY